MNNKIGFIGCGNMGKAIAEGILKTGFIQGDHLFLCDHHEDRLIHLKDQYGVNIVDQKTLCTQCNIVLLGVKPHMYAGLIDQIADQLSDDVLIINIAAGQSTQNVQALFKKNVKVARVMPNTPSLVQEGMSALCFSDNVNKEEQKYLYDMFASLGRCEILSETLMAAAGSASGASPAFVYMFIEAMADGAVRLGFKRDQAYIFCAQAVLGAAKMVLETGEHPGALKDAVCSPGGSTIEGVAVLEERGMRSAVMDALLACNEKSNKMAEMNAVKEEK